MNRALLLTRVVFGFLIVYLHGIPKLMGGPERWQRLGSSLGGSLGIDGVNVFFGFMAMMAETLGGILILVGLYTRISASFLAFTMLVAFSGHLVRDGFAGSEKPLLFLVYFISLILSGAGSFSIDKIWRKK